MANIQLNSNENSALLQSLNQSESKVIPSIYSTKEIYAPSATSWYTITPSSGSSSDGQALSWDLPKYGILQQMIFSYDKNVTKTGSTLSAFVQAGDIFNVIDRIEFLSSSRILFTMYSEDLIAQFANLSTDQLCTINSTALKGTDITGNVTLTETFTVPIVFPMFYDINTCPNLQFNEPTSLRIVFRNTKLFGGNPDTGTLSSTGVSNSRLMLRYKMYSEADNAQLLASNYENEQLNQLMGKMYKENPVSHTTSSANEAYKFTMELKNVDVVEAFNFIVREEAKSGSGAGAANGESYNALQPIKSVTLLASGQELCKLDADQLKYMRLTHNGFPTNNLAYGTETFDPIKLTNAVKVQWGLWSNAGGGPWTNGVSMREMNNVVAEVECILEKNATKYTCYCQEVTSCIVSTSSNVGRVAVALSN
jgi:hypothetical protein